MGRVLGLALLLALGGCDIGGSSVEAAPTTSELRGLPADAQLVGVAITPSGTRYVLDRHSGIYRVDAAGARLVFNTTGLAGLEFTDLVALDDARFAITAENDGFLFDLSTGKLSSYFCYLPPPNPGTDGEGSSQPVVPISVSQTLRLAGIAVSQRTEAVAFNPDTGRLFAQPRTTRLDTGGIAGSELFVFEPPGSEPVAVLPLDSGFVATGMAVVGDRLFLGSGSSLWEAALDGGLTRVGEFASAIDLGGIARAPDGTLWLLDAKGRRLVKFDPEIKLW
ncbi:MAG TPA: hypothetical protein VER12_10135 [Polyangiaceae bacterium]|nr:hypothetical protein [Polyangiaceae bacterium]